MDSPTSERSPPSGTLSNTFCSASGALCTRSMLVARTGRFRSADLAVDIDGCDACIRQLRNTSRRGSSPPPSRDLARYGVVEVGSLAHRSQEFGVDAPGVRFP